MFVVNEGSTLLRELRTHLSSDLAKVILTFLPVKDSHGSIITVDSFVETITDETPWIHNFFHRYISSTSFSTLDSASHLDAIQSLGQRFQSTFPDLPLTTLIEAILKVPLATVNAKKRIICASLFSSTDDSFHKTLALLETTTVAPDLSLFHSRPLSFRCLPKNFTRDQGLVLARRFCDLDEKKKVFLTFTSLLCESTFGQMVLVDHLVTRLTNDPRSAWFRFLSSLPHRIDTNVTFRHRSFYMVLNLFVHGWIVAHRRQRSSLVSFFSDLIDQCLTQTDIPGLSIVVLRAWVAQGLTGPCPIGLPRLVNLLPFDGLFSSQRQWDPFRVFRRFTTDREEILQRLSVLNQQHVNFEGWDNQVDLSETGWLWVLPLLLDKADDCLTTRSEKVALARALGRRLFDDAIPHKTYLCFCRAFPPTMTDTSGLLWTTLQAAGLFQCFTQPIRPSAKPSEIRQAAERVSVALSQDRLLPDEITQWVPTAQGLTHLHDCLIDTHRQVSRQLEESTTAIQRLTDQLTNERMKHKAAAGFLHKIDLQVKTVLSQRQQRLTRQKDAHFLVSDLRQKIVDLDCHALINRPETLLQTHGIRKRHRLHEAVTFCTEGSKRQKISHLTPLPTAEVLLSQKRQVLQTLVDEAFHPDIPLSSIRDRFNIIQSATSTKKRRQQQK